MPPALGLIGLAGAWPALAARAGTSWAAPPWAGVGWVWLLLAAEIAGRGLYLPLVPGIPRPAVWTGSLSQTLHHLLATLVSTGVLAPGAGLGCRRGGAAVAGLGPSVAPSTSSGSSCGRRSWRRRPGAAMAAVHGSPRRRPPPRALGAVAAAAIALAPLRRRSGGSICVRVGLRPEFP